METTTLDDRSPNITYGGGTWILGGVPGKEFDGTTTWTLDVGSTATINFFGSEISVFGTVAPPNIGEISNASYSIDNSTLAFVTWVQHTATQYQQPFFQSTQLSPTTYHTLIITNLGGKLILDFVNITVQVTNPATTMTPAFAAPSAAVSGKPPAKPLLVEEIVGGILVGIFAAVATITVGVIFLKRKRNRRRQKGNGFLFARK